MAKITFSPGDRFISYDGGEKCLGMVLPDMKALIISGRGGRSGYCLEKKDIPNDAITGSQYNFSNEIIFAFDCVAFALDMNISTAKF